MGWREISNDLFLKTCVSSVFLSLCLCVFRFVSVGLVLQGFFFFFFFLLFFLRLSFIQILALVVLSFYHFEGSFHFWALLWGFVLKPFSTCASLMSFSPFCMFLVASFSSGCFKKKKKKKNLLSRGRRRDPFLCVCDLFVFLLFLFCLFVVFLFLLLFFGVFFFFLVWLKKITIILGRIQSISFLYWFCSQQFAELGSILFLAFSARACSLAFCV